VGMYRWGMPLRSNNGPDETASIADCLALPALSEARVLVRVGFDQRVRWPTVTEWPIEDFVSEGDFVLTTGMSLNDDELAEMVRQIANSGAAVFCLGTGPGAFHESVPPLVLETAADESITLIELPWKVRYADVARAIIQLLKGWQAPSLDSALPHAFAKALLGPSGTAGIAQALESVISTPVIIFDAGMTLVGAGPLGAMWVEDKDVERELVAFLAREVRSYGSEQQGRDAERLNDRGLAAVAALVHDGIVGWVVSKTSPTLTSHVQAMRHAATAAAIELVRKIADEEATFHARDALLWDLVSGVTLSEFKVATRAALVGLSVSEEFTVAVGLVEQGQTGSPSLSKRATINKLQRRLTHPLSVTTIREQEVLLIRQSTESTSLDTLASYLSDSAVTISWGQAVGTHRLKDLRSAARQARTALDVQRSLSGPGDIGLAAALSPYMLLFNLVTNEDAIELASRTLHPLENADDEKKSDLLGTLEEFLACHGNISQAARKLYLNRHSLIYRLRRITEITGLNLESHDDRSLLDMALRLRRLRS
jgi:purine catabolism regulator